MVTATVNPKVWRVEFVIEHSEYAKSGIVCFIHKRETGMRVFYSHHVLYNRPVSSGPWSLGSIARQEMNPLLQSMIDTYLLHEILAKGRIGAVDTMPVMPNESIAGVDFDKL